MSAEATTVLLKKRERTQNWIPEEKSALFTLIKHHVNAIENKKIDAAASAMKSLAWQQIYCAFRGRFSADRDITRIREQWRRMKAQARMEMYTYAEKVRTLGPEAAAKSHPSNLSIEVWRLMESVRKNDCEADRSDDSSQDNENPTNRTALHVILDKLTLPTPETSGPGHEIKIEVNSDTEDENSRGELSQKLSDDSFLPQKRSRVATEDEPVDLVEQKTTCPDSVSTSRIDDERNDARNELSSASVGWNDPVSSDKDKSVQRATWIFKSTQREHEIKLRMLHIELERAELQKQTAINELKTSEIKKQLMEDQAAEYYRSIHLAQPRGKPLIKIMYTNAY
ncbi:Regulatory protein zeste [Camponotus japonicus]